MRNATPAATQAVPGAVAISDQLLQQDLTEDMMDKTYQTADGKFFRLAAKEFAFMKKHNLPLPQLYFLDRLKTHITQK